MRENQCIDLNMIYALRYILLAAGSDMLYRDAVSNLGRINEVVDAYNRLISSYLSNDTTQTKGVVLSSIRRILGFVSGIEEGCLTLYYDTLDST